MRSRCAAAELLVPMTTCAWRCNEDARDTGPEMPIRLPARSASRPSTRCATTASGIGVTAIQLAKTFGAMVIATAGSDDKCAACLQLGADHAINYRTHDFVEEIARITAKRGVDVILDMVAGDYLAREVRCLAEDGRIVIIAVQGGINSEVNAGLVLRKRLTITGSTLRIRSVAFKGAIATELHANVWPLLESGKLRTVIHAVLPGAQASAAHALMEAGHHIGKVVLQWETA